jgi:hypothetical protein
MRTCFNFKEAFMVLDHFVNFTLHQPLPFRAFVSGKPFQPSLIT